MNGVFSRPVDLIVVHCSATPGDMDIGAVEIDRWHKENGWGSIGYHAVIRRSGRLEPGRSPKYAGAHAKGHNYSSIGVCLVGGVNELNDPENNFTEEQFDTLRNYLSTLKMWYGDVDIVGHCDLPGVTKACPSFDVKEWLDGNSDSGD